MTFNANLKNFNTLKYTLCKNHQRQKWKSSNPKKRVLTIIIVDPWTTCIWTAWFHSYVDFFLMNKKEKFFGVSQKLEKTLYLAYFIIRIQYITQITYKIHTDWLCLSSVRPWPPAPCWSKVNCTQFLSDWYCMYTVPKRTFSLHKDEMIHRS